MASAKKVHDTSYNVVLTLTAEEAKVLFTIMQSIGGSPQTSKRKYTDNITKALEMLSIPEYDVNEIYEDRVDPRRSIYMKDGIEE